MARKGIPEVSDLWATCLPIVPQTLTRMGGVEAHASLALEVALAEMKSDAAPFVACGVALFRWMASRTAGEATTPPTRPPRSSS